MPFKTADLQKAMISLKQFKTYAMSPHHERYSFPFLCGTYFAYRKIDVMRIISIAKAISNNPKYLEVGCGYGDFLKKIREKDIDQKIKTIIVSAYTKTDIPYEISYIMKIDKILEKPVFLDELKTEIQKLIVPH